MKVRICLVCIINRDFGKGIVNDCTEYMIRKCIPHKYNDDYIITRYNIKRDDQYTITHSDMVIFAGAELLDSKEKTEFAPYISKITQWADNAGVPVCFCPQGEEKAADSSFFSDAIYEGGLNTKSRTIGLSITRPGLFEENGYSEITKEVQVKFWTDAINAIEEKGYKWKLFTIGDNNDYKFAKEILKKLKKDNSKNKYLFPRTASSQELADMVSSFRGIIAGRMHINIMAACFGIPFVGYGWNAEMCKYYDYIGARDRYITPEELDGKAAVDMICEVIESRAKRLPGMSNRKDLLKPLKCFIRDSLKNRKEDNSRSSADWTSSLMATALGTIDNQYFNMNNKEAFRRAQKEGFVNFEADIRLTADNKLVCVDGWSKDTYSRMGIKAKDGKYPALTTQEYFCSFYYDGHFNVLDFAVFAGMAQYEKIDILVLDIGKPSAKGAKKLLKLVNRDMTSLELRKKSYIRVASMEVLKLCRELTPDCMVMYHIPPIAEREEKAIDYRQICDELKAEGVEYVSFTRTESVFSDEATDYFKEKGFKLCIFSCNTYEQIKLAREKKFDLIGTSFCKISEANEYLA